MKRRKRIFLLVFIQFGFCFDSVLLLLLLLAPPALLPVYSQHTFSVHPYPTRPHAHTASVSHIIGVHRAHNTTTTTNNNDANVVDDDDEDEDALPHPPAGVATTIFLSKN